MFCQNGVCWLHPGAATAAATRAALSHPSGTRNSSTVASTAVGNCFHVLLSGCRSTFQPARQCKPNCNKYQLHAASVSPSISATMQNSNPSPSQKLVKSQDQFIKQQQQLFEVICGLQ
jgi:hypothetical protein